MTNTDSSETFITDEKVLFFFFLIYFGYLFHLFLEFPVIILHLFLPAVQSFDVIIQLRHFAEAAVYVIQSILKIWKGVFVEYTYYNFISLWAKIQLMCSQRYAFWLFHNSSEHSSPIFRF